MLSEPTPQPDPRVPAPGPTHEPHEAEEILASAAFPDSPSLRPQIIPEAGLSEEELLLVNAPLPSGLNKQETEKLWSSYQETLTGMLIRMGSERNITDPFTRLTSLRDIQQIRNMAALVPEIGQSAWHGLKEYGLSETLNRLAGRWALMELSAAAGYRTFCLPDLVRGLVKSGKMQGQSFTRMYDTFEFLYTMMQYPLDHPKTLEQLERTNGLHDKYKVAGNETERRRDLFKYIALNMFYIGPAMRPDLTPQERHALCGLSVLVSEKMGHKIAGSTKELEAFISRYEDETMFKRDDDSPLRKRAIAIAQASQEALGKITIISKERVHAHVPFRVKKILELD